MSSNMEVIFTWVIENFKLLPRIKNEFIKSPTFSVKEFLDTDWCVSFFPQGSVSGSSDYISCFLIRSKDKGPQEIAIDFQLSINGETKREIHCFKNESMSWGWHNFLARKKMEHLHTCVIQCHMRIFFPVDVSVDITEEPNYFLTPHSLKHHKMMPNIMKGSPSSEGEDGEITFGTAFCSNQILARTSVSVQKRIFICAIKDYLYPGSKRRQAIPVATAYGTLLIVLFIINRDNNDLLEIEISLKGECKSTCMLICKVELIDSEKKIQSSEEQDHVFKCDEDKHWNFGHLFKWSDIKKLKNASLRFTLAFSNGQYFSEIDWSTGVDERIGALNFPNDVTKKLHCLLSENKFCDATIQTRDESVNAHKIILCSWSPVFAAMFDSDMKEKRSNVIEIDDLDSNTVRHMLHFMHSWNPEKLNADIAMKLYSAADKYQIMSMKDTCRNILKNNLTVENICSILLLADTYQDDELSKSAVSYVSYHREHILKSENWKEFQENHVCICLDILTKISMKFIP